MIYEKAEECLRDFLLRMKSKGELKGGELRNVELAFVSLLEQAHDGNVFKECWETIHRHFPIQTD